MKSNQWISILITLVVVYIAWHMNKKNNTDSTIQAVSGKYSDTSNYKNILPMKDDIFKQITIDLAPFLLLGTITSNDFFNIENFENSAVGKTMFVLLSYGIYYQIVQPYIINKLPNF
jgi:hypothetical protein